MGNSSIYQIKEDDHFVIPFQLVPIVEGDEPPIFVDKPDTTDIHIGNTYKKGFGGTDTSYWELEDFTSETGTPTAVSTPYAPSVLGTYNYDKNGWFHVGDGTINAQIAEHGIPSSENITNGVVTPAWIGDIGLKKNNIERTYATVINFNWWEWKCVRTETDSYKGEDGKIHEKIIEIWEWFEHRENTNYTTQLSAEYYTIGKCAVLDVAQITVKNESFDSDAIYTFSSNDWSKFNIYRDKGGNIHFPVITSGRSYSAGSKTTGPKKIYKYLNNSSSIAEHDSLLKFQEDDAMGANKKCIAEYTCINDHIEVDGEVYLGDTLYKAGVVKGETIDGKKAGWNPEYGGQPYNPDDATTIVDILCEGPNRKLLDEGDKKNFFTPKQIKGLNAEQEKNIPAERFNGTYSLA